MIHIHHSTARNKQSASCVGLSAEELHSHADVLRSFSGRVPDEGGLAGVVSYLESLGSTLRGEAHMPSRQKALQNIGQALLTTHVKSKSEMRFVTEKAMKVFFPGTSGNLSMRQTKASSRNLFLVDMAFMLLTRDRGFKECMVKFGWGDSSPQGGFDFLLFKYRYVPVKELLNAAAALKDLIKSRGGSLGGGFDADDEISMATVRAREAANTTLLRAVLQHLCVPMFYACSLSLLLFVVVVVGALVGSGSVSAVAGAVALVLGVAFDCCCCPGACVGVGQCWGWLWFLWPCGLCAVLCANA